MSKSLSIGFIAIVLSVVSYAQENSDKLDCYSFLQGTQKPVGRGYKPSKMSDFAFERATSTRVCIMSFVQLRALRPVLEQDSQSAAKLTTIDSLYSLRRSAPTGSQQRHSIELKLDEEIHKLFQYVRGRTPEYLAAIADKLRKSKGELQSEGYNPLQAELMARYLEIKALQRDGRSAEIPAVIDEIRAQTAAGSLVDNGLIDQAEEGTYYRAATLWSAITACDLSVRAVQSAGKPDVVSIVAKYFSIPQSSLGIAFAPNVDEFIAPLTKTMKALAANSKNIEAVRLLESVAGVEDSGSHVDVYVESKSGLPARVLRYSRASGHLEILDAVSTFRTDIDQALSRYSTPQMRLASVLREGDHYAIQVAGKKFTLTTAELRTLQSGDPLGSENPLSRELIAADSPIVLYSNPLMHDRSSYLKEAEDVAFAIQRAYPSVQVFRDDFNPQFTPRRVRSIEDFRVAGTSHLVAVIAEDSFRVDDKRLIQNIQATLKAQGVSVKLWKSGQQWDGGSGRAVIVITGHIDEQLAIFVRELGRAGVFKGNYVVFGSCYGELSSRLIREINNDFQAVGTFRFEGKISPYALQDVVTDLTDRITHGQGKFGFPIVLRKSMHLANMSGIWTVCQLELEASYSGRS